MQTIRINLDESLLEEVERAAAALGMSRSALAREALRAALARLEEMGGQQRHRAGYERHPVRPEELGGWEAEQVWPD